MIFTILCLTIFRSQADLTPPEFVSHVIEQFPAVQMAKQDVSIAKAQETTSKGAFDAIFQTNWTQSQGDYEYEYLQSRIVKPTALLGLDLYAGFRQSTGNIPLYDGQLATLSQGEWSVGAKLPLLRGLWTDQRRTQLLKSNLQVKRQTYQLRTTELAQVKKALMTYWDWKLARERFRIQNNLLEVATKRDVWLEKRNRAGDIALFERNDNLRSILQRKSFVLQSHQSLKAAQAELIMYVSDPTLTSRLINSTVQSTERSSDWKLPDELNSLFKPVDHLLQLALTQRPELQALAIQHEQLQADRDLARNEYLPRLDLDTQYSKDRGMGPSSLDDDNIKFSINLEIPLQYRRARGLKEQATQAMERIKFEKQLLQRQWLSEITALQNNLQISIERRELADQEQKLALKLNGGELTRFRQGESSILTVNLREQATAEAELRLAEMTVDVMKNHAALILSLGEIPKH